MKTLLNKLTRKPKPQFPPGTILTDDLERRIERELLLARNIRYF